MRTSISGIDRGGRRLKGVTLLIVATIGAGCAKSESAAAKQAPKPTAPAESSAPAAPAKSSAESPAYRVQMVAGTPLQRGKPGAVEVRLSSKGEYKCNQEYPYKFSFADETQGVTPESPIVRKEAVQLEKKNATISLKLTPTVAGKAHVEGTIFFSVCTEDQCLIEKQRLALDVDVQG